MSAHVSILAVSPNLAATRPLSLHVGQRPNQNKESSSPSKNKCRKTLIPQPISTTSLGAKRQYCGELRKYSQVKEDPHQVSIDQTKLTSSPSFSKSSKETNIDFAQKTPDNYKSFDANLNKYRKSQSSSQRRHSRDDRKASPKDENQNPAPAQISPNNNTISGPFTCFSGEVRHHGNKHRPETLGVASASPIDEFSKRQTSTDHENVIYRYGSAVIYDQELTESAGKQDVCIWRKGLSKQRMEILLDKMDVFKQNKTVKRNNLDKPSENGKLITTPHSNNFLVQLHQKCNEYSQNTNLNESDEKIKNKLSSELSTPSSEKEISVGLILQQHSPVSEKAPVKLRSPVEVSNEIKRIKQDCVLNTLVTIPQPPKLEYSGIYEKELDLTLEGHLDCTCDTDSFDSDGTLDLSSESLIEVLEYEARYNRDINTWTSYSFVHIESGYADDMFYDTGSEFVSGSDWWTDSERCHSNTLPGNWEDDLDELASVYCSFSRHRHKMGFELSN